MADNICSEDAFTAISFKDSNENFSAKAKPLPIVAGWTPCLTSCHALRSISAHITTVDVVPSLATRSWVEDALIIIFAAGCSTLADSKTVTPSLVTKVPPLSSTSSLSKPFGPSVERTAPASAIAACTFFRKASRPLVLSVDWRMVSSAIVLPTRLPTLKLL